MVDSRYLQPLETAGRVPYRNRDTSCTHLRLIASIRHRRGRKVRTPELDRKFLSADHLETRFAALPAQTGSWHGSLTASFAEPREIPATRRLLHCPTTTPAPLPLQT